MMADEDPDYSDIQQALDIDRIVHEPARLVVLAVLSKVEWADFNFLLTTTGLTKGNLSRQASKLEEAGYVEITKFFRGKLPATRYQITAQGREALERYWKQMANLQHSIQEDKS